MRHRAWPLTTRLSPKSTDWSGHQAWTRYRRRWRQGSQRSTSRPRPLRHLGGSVHPAPLGTISKAKPDGSLKHRVIQDLRANHVNQAVTLTERQVLPRALDHAIDLAILREDLHERESIATLVLDFRDAFNSVPLHADERRFNCADAGALLTRERPALYEGEPASGSFVVWQVLGFGGKPNPLVYARAASFAFRTMQALLGSSRHRRHSDHTFYLAYGRGQLYVDDTVLGLLGELHEIHTALDLAIVWWLLLGVPLAWNKGSLTLAAEPHLWIGVVYDMAPDGVLMRLPPDFVAELVLLLSPLTLPGGHLSFQELDVILGKAGRVAFVVPSAKPFVAGLWGGLRGALTADKDRPGQEAPKGRAAARRFATSAAWLLALLQGDLDSLPLERLVTAAPPSPAATSGWRIEFDASIYGGGALLRAPSGAVQEYWYTVWDHDTAAAVNVVPALTKHQTFWELATLLLALVTWGARFAESSVAVLGDNTGALQTALSLKGKMPNLALARELSWRRVRGRWRYEVGHLPSEFNVTADALSRVADPMPPAWPAVDLGTASWSKPPLLQDLWRALPHQTKA